MKLYHYLNKKTAKRNFSRFWFEKVHLSIEKSNSLYEELVLVEWLSNYKH
jgi:ribosomal protein L20